MQYYYGHEAEQFAFYRIPKALFSDPRYKPLSTEAKLLYGLMLDRLSLSLKSGWLDPEGRAFIFYKREDIDDDLQIGHTKAAQLLAELEAAQLIERRRQGLGQPTMIFVGRFVQSPQQLRVADSQTSEIRTSEPPPPDGRPETGRPDVRNPDVHYMMNKTERNNTEILISSPPPSQTPPPSSPPLGVMRLDKMGFIEFFKQQLDFEKLSADRPADAEVVTEMIDQLAGICSSHRQWINIASDQRPRSEVKRQLLKLRREHVEYVLDSMATLPPERQIRNVRSYTLAALYYAPATYAQYKAQAERLKAQQSETKKSTAWMRDYAD